MALSLEAIQANDGDCLLLHYDAGRKPGLIVIDGGSRGVYTNFLKKRLEALRGSSAELPIRLVMVSHIDADHITGILDMCRDLSEAQDNGMPPQYNMRSLWVNSFGELAGGRSAALESSVVGASLQGTIPAGLEPNVEAVVASVPQCNNLHRFAKKLTVLNRETNAGLIVAPESGAKTINVDTGLTFTVLGPHKTDLDKLEDSWKVSKANSGTTEESVAADYLNRTVPNLSSIVVLAVWKGKGTEKRLLLTGDAGGDLILKGLETAGLPTHGKIHVDLLKIQHHGSNHSVDIDFFRRVTADTYLISGNGAHGIPSGETLRWLSKARTGEEYDLYMTNRTGKQGLKEMLDDFLASEAREPKHRYHFRNEAALSISIPIVH